MYALRRFAVRHSRFYQRLYQAFENTIVALDPVFRGIGYNRLERPVAFLERAIKGVLFDCQMCGQCILSSTGMSCPMNCPKNLRNGPCGGVRDGGFCEVKPWMRCVWVEAWEGAARMKNGLDRCRVVQPPVNYELEGSSSWLRVAREKASERRRSKQSDDPSKHALARAFRRARRIEPVSAPIAVEPTAALANQPVREHTTVFEQDKSSHQHDGSRD